MRRPHVTAGALLVVCWGACSPDDDVLANANVMPALVSSSPERGEVVARTTWLVLSFEEPPASLVSTDFALRCGARVAIEAAALSDGRVVINPAAALPAGAQCDLRWRGPDGVERIDIQVADQGEDARVSYDRNERTSIPPLPDDVWLREDESTRTGSRVDLPELDVDPSSVAIVETLRANANTYDGWSPLAPWVVAVDAELDPATLPHSPAESLDAVATVALFDLNDEARVPFYLWDRNETSADGSPSHVLLVAPARRLDPRGRYGLVVSNRALVSVERPLEASAFMRAALTSPSTDDERRAADCAADVMEVASRAEAPFRDDDVALVLRASIRSIDDIVDDHVAVWEQVHEMSGPPYVITEVVPETDRESAVAAFVHGTWNVPDWVGSGGMRIRRDESGRPLAEGEREVDFVLALPRASLERPAPVVMFQHGQPGDAETQVPCEARTHLAEAGFAVAGFTNYLNRDLRGSDDSLLFVQDLLLTGSFADIAPNGPLYLGEQLAFVELLRSLDLDVLPVGAPDGVPDIDPSALMYLGQSGGSAQALSLLAFDTSIRAAAINVAGGRAWAINLHQDGGSTYAAVSAFFPAVTLPMFYAGVVLIQMMQDYADAALLAPFVYREPLDLGSVGRRASILMTEGLGDILVPPVSTRAAAWALGIPMVQPLEPEPFLEVVPGPLSANISPETTAGFEQYDPAGPAVVDHCPPGDPDPTDGHQYTQDSPTARAQRIHFFQTAITDRAPVILPRNDWETGG